MYVVHDVFKSALALVAELEEGVGVFFGWGAARVMVWYVCFKIGWGGWDVSTFRWVGEDGTVVFVQVWWWWCMCEIQGWMGGEKHAGTDMLVV